MSSAPRVGKIVLMQHGFVGSEGSFSGFQTTLLEETEEIVYIDCLSNRTGNVGPVSNQVYMTGSEKVALWMSNFADYYANAPKNKNIYIKTEFKNGVDSVESQREELKMFIDGIKDLGYTRKFNLVGHSKGGLVNTEFTLKYPNEIDKLVSIHSPYGDSSATSFVGEVLGMLPSSINPEIIEGLENITSDDYLKGLRARWNLSSKKNDLYIVAGVAVKIDKTTLVEIGFDDGIEFLTGTQLVSDGVVFLKDQTGASEEEPLTIDSNNIRIYDRSYVYLGLPELVNTDIISNLVEGVNINPIVDSVVGFVGNLTTAVFTAPEKILIGLSLLINEWNPDIIPFHHMNTCDQPETVRFTAFVLFD
ncbi:MAG: hypothetical protein KQ78_01565 [Candidatus Izimaplasma bacterium HR2]|nr:MAG: hypothetical protein KQ78_01565 [Candidatus Izimaplasma bacterium HR2]